MTRLEADALLLAAAIVWGVTFVVQKDIGALPPMAFVAARFVVSALALAPLALFEGRRASRPVSASARRLAAVIGLMLFLGASLQQVGIATTSATNAGFLTACYVVLTPFVVWALSRTRPRAIVLLASAVSLAGAWLLATGGGPGAPPTAGDGIVLLSDLAWATGIALTPLYLARTERPLTLAFTQYALCAALAAAASLAFETAPPAAFVAAAPEILFAGLVSGALGYTLAIFGQRHTPPAEAALILSLESVFAALAGALWLGERLTPAAAAGCGLILLGALAAEAAPALIAGKAARRNVALRRDRGARL
ncbi:EamA-like transporter family protein [Roseiarcus fermentans]|uniref:EamA-like transporter family protein n=1 Tax=Roseiarcus fermentans TaxID=1473586 RepID=A0A366F5R4_9HYPH|nr:DMT family transporter [Roseiarcus fermentans]RBP09109.1 EamA-like transporter family protein [Roseiarcus fermentans]